MKGKKSEFDLLIEDIINNDNFKELDKELHHGITRYGHSMHVAKGVYDLTKKLHFNYKEATRAALLHDFYFNYQLEDNNEIKKLAIHPELAYLNASKYYKLTDLQKNIILSHMFPLGNAFPKYKESFCITLVDKIVAIYEQQRYKIGMKLGVYFLFIFNMLTLHK